MAFLILVMIITDLMGATMFENVLLVQLSNFEQIEKSPISLFSNICIWKIIRHSNLN